jgi:hypothetical protein
MEQSPLIQNLLGELRSGLTRYWEIADTILGESGVRLNSPGEAFFSFRKNFFSLLFLYSFHRADIPKSRRILYAATLQCLRGMVTGCDNLLDDEYKMTLDTDLPETAIRFRSVMDIMVSDRVLFALLLDDCRRGEIGMDQAGAAVAASMKTMTQSGIQEASEEAGITEILTPEAILSTVHHFKTGILFTCPWDIPALLEKFSEDRISPIKAALYRIGMGCQILDDLVDMAGDIARRRHNYVVSLVHHGQGSEKDRLSALYSPPGGYGPEVDPATAFPGNFEKALTTAREFLESGLTALYPEPHRYLVAPSIRFLESRIGTDRLVREGCCHG